MTGDVTNGTEGAFHCSHGSWDAVMFQLQFVGLSVDTSPSASIALSQLSLDRLGNSQVQQCWNFPVMECC